MNFDILVNKDNMLKSDYIPKDLGLVATHSKLNNLTLHRPHILANITAIHALDEMLLAAKKDGADGFVLISAYRSYAHQQLLYDKKLEQNPNYGKDGKLTTLAYPGASEHQTGLAFDILSVEHKELSESFADTIQGKWLLNNAYKYGFILRFPKDKQDITKIIYEPWHYRFVGKEVARETYENNLCLEEYTALKNKQTFNKNKQTPSNGH